MNIVLSLNNYTNLTGSEIYVYELSRVLSLYGHRVSVIATMVGGEIAEKTRKNGAQVYSFFDHPKLPVDVMHLSQPGPTAYCLRFFDAPAVVTVHSQLKYEDPILDDRIKTYITIRPQIRKHLESLYPELVDRLAIVYNGVDRKRFFPKGEGSKKLLFVGTNDHLRAQVVQDLVERAKKEKLDLVTVGAGFPNPPVWNIENYVQDCTQTAGIYLGRTTIEGWLCGKPGWIYDVDENGNILSIDLYDVPEEEKLKQFDIFTMTDRLLEIYKKAL